MKLIGAALDTNRIYSFEKSVYTSYLHLRSRERRATSSGFRQGAPHAREYRRQARIARGTYMTLPQALHTTTLVQSALSAFDVAEHRKT